MNRSEIRVGLIVDIQGEFKIPASRECVWAALNDLHVLEKCIPGCQSLVKESDNELIAKMESKIGPVKAKFDTRVVLSDLIPPESYVISGEGKGGAAGFAKGSAKVCLAEDGEGTILTYTANVKVGGKIAQIGSRLVAGTARKLALSFFESFIEQLQT